MNITLMNMICRNLYRSRGVIAIVVCIVIGFQARADGSSVPSSPPVTLHLGDAAPALAPSKWIQGKPVDKFEPGKVYIVEFWATWCGPCRRAIPHLNEIYQKFGDKGLVVIGQDVFEKGEEGGDVVAKVVKGMGTKMTYPVALDTVSGGEDRGKMATSWLLAAGQSGIPTAFVVDQAGKIAWIGNPLESLDKVVEDVLDGKFNQERAGKFAAEEEKTDSERGNEARAKYEKCKPYLDAIAAALDKKDWDKVFAGIDDMEKAVPPQREEVAGFSGYDGLRLAYAADKKDGALAAKIARRMIRNIIPPHDDSGYIASKLLAVPGLAPQDAELAVQLAGKCLERTRSIAGIDQSEVAVATAQLARAEFMNGKRDQALETQRKAVELANDEQLKTQMQGILQKYMEGKLPEPPVFHHSPKQH